MNQSGPLWEQLLVAATGPVVAAVLGTLVVGLLAQWISRRVQDDRDASAVRRQLVIDLTEVAGASTLELGTYHRTKQKLAELDSDSDVDHSLPKAREALDRRHFDTRVRGWVLERRLEIHFGVGSAAYNSWHKTLDALHLAYLRLVERPIADDDLSTMLDHTGLNDQLVGNSSVDTE